MAVLGAVEGENGQKIGATQEKKRLDTKHSNIKIKRGSQYNCSLIHIQIKN